MEAVELPRFDQVHQFGGEFGVHVDLLLPGGHCSDAFHDFVNITSLLVPHLFIFVFPLSEVLVNIL